MKAIIRTSKTSKNLGSILLMRGGYESTRSEDGCLANEVEDNQILCFSFAFGHSCLFMVGLGVVNGCWIM